MIESPWLIHTDLVDGEIGEQQRRTLDVQLGAAVLALPGLRDLAAEIARDELRAVTDAEDGNARVVDRGVDVGRAGDVHRRRATREDDRLRVAGEHLRDRHRARDDLAVDVHLAHPPRDQLRVLRPEVDDEDEVGRVVHAHGRSDHRPIPMPCARCSDLPSVFSAGATITSAFWNSLTVS